MKDPDCWTCWSYAVATKKRVATCPWCRGEGLAIRRRADGGTPTSRVKMEATRLHATTYLRNKRERAARRVSQ